MTVFVVLSEEVDDPSTVLGVHTTLDGAKARCVAYPLTAPWSEEGPGRWTADTGPYSWYAIVEEEVSE